MWNRFKTLDPWLFAIPAVLIPVGVVVIYSLTITSQGSSLYLHQAVYGVIGIILMLVATFLDYRSLKGWAWWIYGVGLAGLIAVKAVGTSEFGAQRWISLGSFQLQPSEIEKVVVIIILAALLGRTLTSVTLPRFLVVILVITLPVVAVVLQPDLGTAIVIGVTGVGMVLHARLTRLERGVVAVGLLVVVLSFALAVHGTHPFSSLLKGYQRDRLVGFINPRSESGYNVLQSMIAVGSGGLTGKGLGLGSQSQLNFVPVAHADFIFAGIGESWGLVGAAGVIILYSILMVRVVQAARIAKDEFGMLLCIGVAVKLLVEVMVNIGMNIRLMPVTGIPLPFLSYGGTTLMANALAVGLVQSVVIRYKRLTF